MSTWKKIAMVNGGGLAGIIISLFIVSPQTPLWLFAALSAAALGGLNYVCFGWQTASGERKSGIESTLVIAFGCLVLLLELLFRYWHR